MYEIKIVDDKYHVYLDGRRVTVCNTYFDAMDWICDHAIG